MKNQQQTIKNGDKSLVDNINDIITMFDYSDFAPKIDNHAADI